MMDSDLEMLLATVARLPDQADVDVVFGSPTTIEGRTLIPAAEVTYSFEVGAERGAAGEGDAGTDATSIDEGSAYIRSRPVALIEVAPGGIAVRPVLDLRRLAPRLLILAGWTAFWLATAIIQGSRGRR